MAQTYSILLAGLEPSEEALVSTHFGGLGHKIIRAVDLPDACAKLASQAADVLYFRATPDDKTVREIEDMTARFASIPVVLICESPADGFVLKAWHAGAADILFPPLAAGVLNTSLQHCSSRISTRKQEPLSHTQARLFYLDEAGKECWAKISPPRFTVGRSSGNDLILGQREISRSHAEILVRQGEYLLRDLGSKQGTYLNDVRVEESGLSDGDRIQLGGPHGITLVFHSGDLLHSLLGISGPRTEISLSVRGFKEVGMLFAVFRALSSTPVLDDLLALVLDAAIELTGAERGFIMLKEEDESLSFRCARNSQKRTLDGSCFQTSNRVPYEVLKTGRPVVIKDLDFDDQCEDHTATRRLGLRSISCVPLRYSTVHDPGDMSNNQNAFIIGALYVDSSNVGAGFSNMRLDALESLASEATMAIYNARLYKESQDKRRMEEQLAIAREIQQSLYPQPERKLDFVNAVSQNLPCNEVGGDYFDYFELDRGRFGFALGDVAGKGMSAALLASLFQGVLSSQARFEAPLPTMISGVNQILTQRGTGNRFITFFFGILEPDGNCTYVNAGHNPPLVVGRDGSMKELTDGGMVLGLFAGAKYEAGSVKLQPDDHLVLFTDGVVEALNSEDEEFGMDRLTALLRANAKASTPEILNRLRDAVIAFSANTPQHDDITVMVIGYRES
ncbi:MAG: SpoIIE family protein phosphatase [Acidobacteria bacterium]|nr:SpoIIE family protein phosphatase [Acidobacteriota bacterium]